MHAIPAPAIPPLPGPTDRDTLLSTINQLPLLSLAEVPPLRPLDLPLLLGEGGWAHVTWALSARARQRRGFRARVSKRLG